MEKLSIPKLDVSVFDTAKRYPYRIWGGVSLLVLTILLAACGGGDKIEQGTASSQATSSIQATSSGEGRATILSIPPRAPVYQVINGITVPPEPAPSINNATLAGVDINNNGVRDDVERLIAQNTTNKADFLRAVVVVKAYSSILQLPKSATKAQAVSLQNSIICTSNSVNGVPNRVNAGGEIDLRDLLFNTPQRIDAQNKFALAIADVDFEEISCD